MAGDTIDLATENQNVKDYLNQAMHHYMDMGVDAIRVDTAKHIERDNLLEFIDDWRAYKPSVFRIWRKPSQGHRTRQKS